jgi:O-antigen biosynthesis protein
MTGPLISCIMPVADRHEFLPGALACFASQDWPERELIVIDNGRHGCRHLVRDAPRVQYWRVEPGKYRIGALRNIACSRASGDIIAHWDSDDWYGPERLSRQIAVLMRSDAGATGYHILPFADDNRRQAWLYRGSPGYACGASLLYLRSAWAGVGGFPAEPLWGEDNEFIRRLGGRLTSECGRSIVARIHDCGTSPRDVAGWQEIDYAGLAARGYPVAPAARIEPEDIGIRDRENRGCALVCGGKPAPDDSRAPDDTRNISASGRSAFGSGEPVRG